MAENNAEIYKVDQSKASKSIRERRRALRLTQARLACEVGIRAGAIALAENGNIFVHDGRDYRLIKDALTRLERQRADHMARLDFSSFNSDPGDGGPFLLLPAATHVETQSSMGEL